MGKQWREVLLLWGTAGGMRTEETPPEATMTRMEGQFRGASSELEKISFFQHNINKGVMTVAGILSLIVAILAVFKGGDWIVAAVFCTCAFCFYVALANAKLEISPRGFSYRALDLQRKRFVGFDQIDKAYFEEDRRGDVPAAAFWVRLRDGQKLRVPLPLFPMRASALMFQQLDRHEIPIAEPHTPTTQRAIEAIRNEQSKIFGG